jgi:hypothetical protein
MESEVKELRDEIEALRQQFAEYVEAQTATDDIESILASNGELDGEATADRGAARKRPRKVTDGTPHVASMSLSRNPKTVYYFFSCRRDVPMSLIQRQPIMPIGGPHSLNFFFPF